VGVGFQPNYGIYYRMNSRGATIIEWVVILFVTGLLVGISVPVFTTWQDRVAEIKCAENLIEIGLALNAYGADHDGKWPVLATDRSLKSQNIPVLDTVLLKYASSPEIFICPADNRDIHTRTGTSYQWDFFPQGLAQKGGVPDLSTAAFKVESKPPLLHQAVVLDKEAFHRIGSHSNGLYLIQPIVNP
jgi:competence protein ComGC